MKWLITGGCGFIGLNLVKVLLEDDQNIVRIIDNLKVGQREDLAGISGFNEIPGTRLLESGHNSFDSKVELIVGDILDAQLAVAATKDIEIVVHLAANTGVPLSIDDPRSDCENNILGTFNYLEAARINKVRKFIFASSGAPVGDNTPPPIHEEIAPHPVSPYGASKLAGEGYCSAYYRSFGLNTVALRFGNVYGPGSHRKTSVVAKFINQSVMGQPCEIYGDGKQTRDFIYIADLISAIIKAAANDCGGEIFQIATNREHTLNELCKILSEVLAARGFSMEIKYSDARIGDVLRNYSDTRKAERILDWRPEFELYQGLTETVDWFLASQK